MAKPFRIILSYIRGQRRGRVAEPFRIFLSYNRRDMTDGERLAKALVERDVTPFKDDWYLSPGEHRPSALDRHLAHCGAVAVVIGANGLGPWQQREVYAAIDREVRERAQGRESFRVIPVLLSDGALAHAGLAFLSQNVWVKACDPRAPDLLAGALEGTPRPSFTTKPTPTLARCSVPTAGFGSSARRTRRSTSAGKKT